MVDEVDTTKKALREFFRKQITEYAIPELVEKLLSQIDPIIEIFGWVYPQDAVVCCGLVLNKIGLPYFDASALLDKWEGKV